MNKIFLALMLLVPTSSIAELKEVPFKQRPLPAGTYRCERVETEEKNDSMDLTVNSKPGLVMSPRGEYYKVPWVTTTDKCVVLIETNEN